ncbi:MAG: hypothetical protein JO122_09645 [Acetobacteraceae bacterium]|nr:hypothetical protein [Acetobacteraceae bacterium]
MAARARNLNMAAAGQRNKAIANALGISVHAVVLHRTRITARLGVRTFTAGVRVATLAEVASCFTGSKSE